MHKHTTQQQEDIHISYISALCADAGISYDTQRHDDDSTDGIIKKRIMLPDGSFFDAQLRIQLKSTSSLSQYTDDGNSLTYKLNVKNYNDLCMPSTIPIVLGLLILPEDENARIQWSTEELLIRGCMYWADFSRCKKSDNRSKVSVRINKANILNQDVLLNILEKIAKEEWL